MSRVFVFSITSFEVKQKPAITEVEVSVVSVLLHQFKQLRVQDLLVKRQNDLITLFDLHTILLVLVHKCVHTWISERILAK